MITKTFKEFYKWNTFICYMTKIFFSYVLTGDYFLYNFFRIFFIGTIHQYAEVEGF